MRVVLIQVFMVRVSSQLTLCDCLNVQELRYELLSVCDGTLTDNHVVLKITHMVHWLCVFIMSYTDLECIYTL